MDRGWDDDPAVQTLSRNAPPAPLVRRVVLAGAGASAVAVGAIVVLDLQAPGVALAPLALAFLAAAVLAASWGRRTARAVETASASSRAAGFARFCRRMGAGLMALYLAVAVMLAGVAVQRAAFAPGLATFLVGLAGLVAAMGVLRWGRTRLAADLGATPAAAAP